MDISPSLRRRDLSRATTISQLRDASTPGGKLVVKATREYTERVQSRGSRQESSLAAESSEHRDNYSSYSLSSVTEDAAHPSPQLEPHPRVPHATHASRLGSVRSNVTDASGSSARSSPPKYSVDQADAVRGGWGFLATVEQQTNNLHRLRLARIQEREEHYRRLEEHHLEQSKAHYRTMAAEARRREEAAVVIQRAWRRFWSWRSVVARERQRLVRERAERVGTEAAEWLQAQEADERRRREDALERKWARINERNRQQQLEFMRKRMGSRGPGQMRPRDRVYRKAWAETPPETPVVQSKDAEADEADEAGKEAVTGWQFQFQPVSGLRGTAIRDQQGFAGFSPGRLGPHRPSRLLTMQSQPLPIGVLLPEMAPPDPACPPSPPRSLRLPLPRHGSEASGASPPGPLRAVLPTRVRVPAAPEHVHAFSLDSMSDAASLSPPPHQPSLLLLGNPSVHPTPPAPIEDEPEGPSTPRAGAVPSRPRGLANVVVGVSVPQLSAGASSQPSTSRRASPARHASPERANAHVHRAASYAEIGPQTLREVEAARRGLLLLLEGSQGPGRPGVAYAGLQMTPLDRSAPPLRGAAPRADAPAVVADRAATRRMLRSLDALFRGLGASPPSQSDADDGRLPLAGLRGGEAPTGPLLSQEPMDAKEGRAFAGEDGEEGPLRRMLGPWPLEMPESQRVSLSQRSNPLDPPPIWQGSVGRGWDGPVARRRPATVPAQPLDAAGAHLGEAGGTLGAARDAARHGAREGGPRTVGRGLTGQRPATAVAVAGAEPGAPVPAPAVPGRRRNTGELPGPTFTACGSAEVEEGAGSPRPFTPNAPAQVACVLDRHVAGSVGGVLQGRLEVPGGPTAVVHIASHKFADSTPKSLQFPWPTRGDATSERPRNVRHSHAVAYHTHTGSLRDGASAQGPSLRVEGEWGAWQTLGGSEAQSRECDVGLLPAPTTPQHSAARATRTRGGSERAQVEQRAQFVAETFGHSKLVTSCAFKGGGASLVGALRLGHAT